MPIVCIILTIVLNNLDKLNDYVSFSISPTMIIAFIIEITLFIISCFGQKYNVDNGFEKK